MEVLRWIIEHWLDFLQSVGIIAGLLFTVHTIRTDAKSRRIGNLIAFAQQHHDIWKQMYERPELARVFENEADLNRAPVTHEERMFAKLLILHLDSVHRAMKEDMFVSLSGLQKTYVCLSRGRCCGRFGRRSRNSRILILSFSWNRV